MTIKQKLVDLYAKNRKFRVKLKFGKNLRITNFHDKRIKFDRFVRQK